jgi:hypothetical protein
MEGLKKVNLELNKSEAPEVLDLDLSAQPGAPQKMDLDLSEEMVAAAAEKQAADETRIAAEKAEKAAVLKRLGISEDEDSMINPDQLVGGFGASGTAAGVAAYEQRLAEQAAVAATARHHTGRDVLRDYVKPTGGVQTAEVIDLDSARQQKSTSEQNRDQVQREDQAERKVANG